MERGFNWSGWGAGGVFAIESLVISSSRQPLVSKKALTNGYLRAGGSSWRVRSFGSEPMSDNQIRTCAPLLFCEAQPIERMLPTAIDKECNQDEPHRGPHFILSCFMMRYPQQFWPVVRNICSHPRGAIFNLIRPLARPKRDANAIDICWLSSPPDLYVMIAKVN